MNYVADKRIFNAFWCPDNWSVFNQYARTNNDIEGVQNMNFPIPPLPPPSLQYVTRGPWAPATKT